MDVMQHLRLKLPLNHTEEMFKGVIHIASWHCCENAIPTSVPEINCDTLYVHCLLNVLWIAPPYQPKNKYITFLIRPITQPMIFGLFDKIVQIYITFLQ